MMKKISKILIAILTVVIAVNTLCISAFAANTTPGNSGSVSITFSNIYGLDGSVTAVGDDIFESYSVSNGYGTSFIDGSHVKTSFTVEIEYTLKSDAAIGSSAYFQFDGEKTVSLDANYVGVTESTSAVSASVNVVKASTPSGGGSSSGSRVDYTELKAQIAAAEKLTESEYTSDSWNAMQAALESARAALSSKKQADVTQAADALKNAIAALERLNRGELGKELGEIAAFLQGNDATAAKSFVDAYTAALALMSGNATQEEIDAAAKALSAAFEELKAALNKPAETVEVPGQTVVITEKVEVPGETVEVEKIVEVPGETVTSIVEVPGETVEVEKIVEVEVKNGLHNVWFALFLFFAATTTVLVVLFAVSSARRKNSRRDTTPLVDYNIEDDDL